MHRSFHVLLDIILRNEDLLGGLGGPGNGTGAWQGLLEDDETKAVTRSAVIAAAKLIDRKCSLKPPVDLTTFVRQNIP